MHRKSTEILSNTFIFQVSSSPFSFFLFLVRNSQGSDQLNTTQNFELKRYWTEVTSSEFSFVVQRVSSWPSGGHSRPPQWIGLSVSFHELVMVLVPQLALSGLKLWSSVLAVVPWHYQLVGEFALGQVFAWQIDGLFERFCRLGHVPYTPFRFFLLKWLPHPLSSA